MPDKNNLFELSKYECIVIGSSAGGLQALSCIFKSLPLHFPIPIVVVQHLHPDQSMYFIESLNQQSDLIIKDANEKEKLSPGTVYFSPPNYHLLVEDDKTLSLSFDEKVNFSRPSIDILFESAADVFKSKLLGIILTGANSDGAKGLFAIKKKKGTAMVQDPATAEYPAMPEAAIELCSVDYIISLEEIGRLLNSGV